MRDVQQIEQEFDLHNGVDPAEIYFGEPVTASVLLTKSGIKIPSLSVFRVSPFGIEIKMKDKELEQLTMGDKIDVDVDFGKQHTSFKGVLVGSLRNLGALNLLGVRLFPFEESRDLSEERRSGKRWSFSEAFLPTGVAPNTLRFNDYIYFKMRDVSSSGFLMETSLRNKFLIKGVNLNCRLNFPLIGETNVQVEVRNARKSFSSDKEILLKGFLTTVADYTVQFSSQPAAEDLKNAGMKPTSVSNGLTFGFVKNEDEYRDVLKLRHLAYAQVGKMDPKSPIESAGDIYDSRARILYAKHNGKTVGSIRIMFHSATDEFEHEQFIELPKNFPKKENIVEMTRFCTDPNYRGMDLFYAICARAALAIVQSGRQYMLGSTVDKLLPIYQKIGWAPTGVFYNHEGLGNEKHQILLCDMRACVRGEGISYSVWKNVYRDVFEFLSSNDQIAIDPIHNTKLFLYESISRFFS
jgi:hypothetical protein